MAPVSYFGGAVVEGFVEVNLQLSLLAVENSEPFAEALSEAFVVLA